jgi:hypothetical protein
MSAAGGSFERGRKHFADGSFCFQPPQRRFDIVFGSVMPRLSGHLIPTLLRDENPEHTGTTVI